jgi:hypothetical protein
LEGLIAERNERKEKRLAKDMKEASKVFEWDKDDDGDVWKVEKKII